jgi:hypothetical protein
MPIEDLRAHHVRRGASLFFGSFPWPICTWGQKFCTMPFYKRTGCCVVKNHRPSFKQRQEKCFPKILLNARFVERRVLWPLKLHVCTELSKKTTLGVQSRANRDQEA